MSQTWKSFLGLYQGACHYFVLLFEWNTEYTVDLDPDSVFSKLVVCQDPVHLPVAVLQMLLDLQGCIFASG